MSRSPDIEMDAAFDSMREDGQAPYDPRKTCHDTGCSCPSPFEDVTELSGLSDGTYREMTGAVSRVFDKNNRLFAEYSGRTWHNIADAKARLTAFRREVSGSDAA